MNTADVFKDLLLLGDIQISFNPQFKRNVKNGKAFICQLHFKDEDIQYTSLRSWIKLGL